MTSAAPPTEFFPGINFNPSFYNLGQSAVTLDYLNSNFLRSTGYAISRAQYTLFNGAVDIKQNLDVSGNVNAKAYFLDGVPFTADQWTKVNDDIYNNNTGNVGIGKTNPTYKLDVSGSMNVSDNLRIGEVLIEEYIRNYLATDTPEFEQINIPKLLIKANYGPFLELQKQDGESIYSAFVYISPLNPAMFCFDAGGAGGTNTAIHFRTRGNEKLIISETENTFYNSIKFANNNNLIFNGSYNQLTDKLTGDGTTVTINNGVISTTGSTYTDANVRTVLSNSAGTNMTWNSTTNKFDVAASYTDTNVRTVLSNSAGTNIVWNSTTNKFDGTYTYTLPIATTTILGGVKSDNDTVSIDGTGIIKVSGNSKYLTGGTVSNVWGWNGVTSLLGRVGTAGNLSTFSQVEDIVLRSQGRLLLQTGTGNTGLTIDGANNVLMRNNVSVGSATITSGYALDVTGNIITSGNIALTFASRSIFWFGTNSNLARVGITGEYSTSGAFGDIVLRSDSRLILQSGTGAFGMLIDTTNNVLFRNNVGIGTTTIISGNVLDVNSKLKVSSTAPSNSLTISATTGNVGLGISSASNLLHLNKAASGADVRLQITDGFTGTGAANGLVLGKGTDNRFFLYNYANTDLYFGTNAVERMRIASNGNVGIGTTAPNDFLHLHKNTANTDVSFTLTDLTTGSAFGNGFRIRKMTTEDVEIVNGHNKDLIFGANNTNFMRIKDYGAVGIQTNGYAIPNNYMWGGSLTIGNIVNNYGGGQGWNTSTAGLLMECLDSTEIAVHDSGNSIHSFMRYTTNGNFTIGRNMGYGTANLSVDGALSVGGTNINSIIDQRIKDKHLFSVYRTSITFYSILGGGYWEGVWDFETNLKFNEYNRPQLNVRWNISGSINNYNGNDSNKYFFMNYFYNQLGNNIAFNTTHSYGTWSFQNWWNGGGNNYLRIICRLDAAADYLNINIS